MGKNRQTNWRGRSGGGGGAAFLQGYATYPELLEDAHSRGLKSITTELKQVPGPDPNNPEYIHDTAICYAEVVLVDKDGKEKLFTGVGDANPGNVGRTIQPHIIRMSETRAKARALKDATNNKKPIAGVDDYETEEPEPAEVVPFRNRGGKSGGRTPITTEQYDKIEKLATQLRGDKGLKKLEEKLGYVVADMDRGEADAQIAELEEFVRNQQVVSPLTAEKVKQPKEPTKA